MAATSTAALQALARLARSDEVIAKAHLVGGCVRDALLGRPLRDIDISAVDAPTFAARAAQVVGSRVVALGGAVHPLYRVPLDGGQLDVVPCRGRIEDDLVLRDFTVNAMAIPLDGVPPNWPATPAPVLDPHGGRADIDARIIRAVTVSVFLNDPVRALRAARLSAELGFSLDAATAAALPSALSGLAKVAPERVGTELLRLFDAEHARSGVQILENADLLGFCFPELAQGQDVDQHPLHTYTVYRHQVVAFERVDLLLARTAPSDREDRRLWSTLWEGTDWPETRWGPLRGLLDRHRAAVRIATLLHDIGKPSTRTVAADGRTRFLGHAEIGATMAGDRLRAWRFSSAMVDRVALLIAQHLTPGQLSSPGEAPTDRALYRFHRALGDATPDVCWLFLADSLATAPESAMTGWPAYVEHVRRIVAWRPRGPADGLPRIIDGRGVMAATGIPPGPAVGRILLTIEEAVAAGDVGSSEEAMDLARLLASSQDQGVEVLAGEAEMGHPRSEPDSPIS